MVIWLVGATGLCIQAITNNSLGKNVRSMNKSEMCAVESDGTITGGIAA